MTRHERLLENYEDAYFALLMEDVAQMENARLDRFNTELQNDPHAAVPEELTKRCLKTINAFGISFLRSQDFFLLTYTIPVRDSAALTAYTPTPASMVLGEPVLPSSFAVVAEL